MVVIIRVFNFSIFSYLTNKSLQKIAKDTTGVLQHDNKIEKVKLCITFVHHKPIIIPILVRSQKVVEDIFDM